MLSAFAVAQPLYDLIGRHPTYLIDMEVGLPAVLWLRQLGLRETTSLAFFGATALALIVAIVTIGQQRGAISDTVGAALIGAGMISVLVFPIVGTRIAAGKKAEAEIPELPPAQEF